MPKHEIEIEGLPEGWKAVAYRFPAGRTEYTLDDDMNPVRAGDIYYPCIIVQKIKPRRIVLEDTGEYWEQGIFSGNVIINAADLPSHICLSNCSRYRVYREVKECE